MFTVWWIIDRGNKSWKKGFVFVLRIKSIFDISLRFQFYYFYLIVRIYFLVPLFFFFFLSLKLLFLFHRVKFFFDFRDPIFLRTRINFFFSSSIRRWLFSVSFLFVSVRRDYFFAASFPKRPSTPFLTSLQFPSIQNKNQFVVLDHRPTLPFLFFLQTSFFLLSRKCSILEQLKFIRARKARILIRHKLMI